MGVTGVASDYEECYAASWGQFMDRTKAVMGNHDYDNGGGEFLKYFASNIGPARHPTYYAFGAGRWRLYVVDTNCGSVDCEAEANWLRRQLNQNPTRCVGAFFHHPLHSSTTRGGAQMARPFFRILHRARADLVVSAHRHAYERFANMGVSGPDSTGPREFVVGTGGSSRWHAWRATPVAGSEVRIGQTWGALRLALRWDGYSWAFLDVAGTELDAGTDRCTRR